MLVKSINGRKHQTPTDARSQHKILKYNKLRLENGLCAFLSRINDMKSTQLLFFFNLFIYLIYLFLAALGLPCCVRAFSSCGERGLLFVAVRGLLIAVASLVRSTGSRHAGFRSCGTRAQQLWLAGSRAQAQ